MHGLFREQNRVDGAVAALRSTVSHSPLCPCGCSTGYPSPWNLLHDHLYERFCFSPCSFSYSTPHAPRAGIAIALAGTLLASSACTTDESSEAPNSSTALGSGGKQSTDPTEPKRLNVQVDKSHPWDKSSFTQGVETDAEGSLVVGTGQYKQSRIYRTTLDGKQSDSHDLPNDFFGEGLTIAGDAVWQLTWKEHTAIKRKSSDLSEIGRARYEGEGWGLCSQKDRLVMSDGTGTLSFRDPATFAKTGEVSVTKAGQATTMLNELECAPDGSV